MRTAGDGGRRAGLEPGGPKIRVIWGGASGAGAGGFASRAASPESESPVDDPSHPPHHPYRLRRSRPGYLGADRANRHRQARRRAEDDQSRFRRLGPGGPFGCAPGAGAALAGQSGTLCV